MNGAPRRRASARAVSTPAASSGWRMRISSDPSRITSSGSTPYSSRTPSLTNSQTGTDAPWRSRARKTTPGNCSEIWRSLRSLTSSAWTRCTRSVTSSTVPS